MQNIIIVHMESLNSAFYYTNQNMFPNLRKVQEQGIFFSNYWSTATSTIMTVCDLMYGNDVCSGQSPDLVRFVLDEAYGSFEKQPGMEFQNKKMIFSPRFDWIYDFIDLKMIMGKDTCLCQGDNYPEFCGLISDAVKNMNGDFLYIYDWSPLVMKSKCRKKFSTWNEYYVHQYCQTDNVLGLVLEELEKTGKKDQTLCIIFGDHGDDLYSYGLNDGFTHAIPPYPNMIRTPLAFYGGLLEQGTDDSLVCTFDIGHMAAQWWRGNVRPEHKRNYVFSRNLFPRQQSVLEKGYSVTDGIYMLLITSKGLEMYICRFIQHSNFNILNWFKLDRNGRLIIKTCANMHFKRLIREQAADFEEAFYKMRVVLYRKLYVLIKKRLLDNRAKQWFYHIHYNRE